MMVTDVHSDYLDFVHRDNLCEGDKYNRRFVVTQFESLVCAASVFSVSLWWFFHES